MRRCLLAAGLGLLLVTLVVPAGATGLHSRKKPGPKTIRGVAVHVQRGHFTLRTLHNGSYSVVMASATHVVEKGKAGRLTVHEGDHVGVRGFVSGRSLRAIEVRIYPTKPKPYSVTGKLTAIHGSSVSILTSGRTVTVFITGSTGIVVNRGSGSIRDLRTGDRVEVRVESASGRLVALHIHVFRSASRAQRVQIRGTVTRSSAGAVAVRSGARTYLVRLTHQTVVYLGAQRASRGAVRAGASVTVYACCSGAALTATSIHIRKTATVTHTVLVRGRIVALSPTALTLRSGASNRRIVLASSTVYELGAQRAGRTSLQLGDDVSVRAIPSGAEYRAVRVHVYMASRRVHTVIGVVSGVGRGQITVTARGKRYVVQTGSSGVSLNGKRASITSLRPGDHVRVVGKEPGAGVVQATSILATRPAPKLQTVHGAIVQASGNSLVVSDGAGRRIRVQLAPGTRPELLGRPAPAAALFPGARVSVRGRMERGVMIASRVTLEVKPRTVRGRVRSQGSSWLVVGSTSGRTTRVDLPASTLVSDAGSRRPLSVIRVGTWLRVDGFDESGQSVRAAALQIQHPILDFAGVVVAVGTRLTVRTTAGERYVVHISPTGTQISTTSTGIKLTQGEIPSGCRLHVRGKGATDGSVTATSLVVHLPAQEVRGPITALAASTLTVAGASGAVTVRVSSATSIAQGSKSLTLDGLVVGDQVTVYGYAIAGGAVAARKVLVHRRLLGLDGTVDSQTANGFVLEAADGSHRVLVSSSTVLTGLPASGPTPGLSVHVTGYLRGDGSILATRVRAGKRR